jgi:hypothetical protein
MKRLTFIVGHYGSGKTEFAVNLALQNHVDFFLDLDIVNPFFRSRELDKLFQSHQISLISTTPLNGAYGDLPYLSKDIFLPFHDTTKTAIFDLGGNDSGAIVMRQFSDFITEDIDLWMVVNVYRQQTQTIEDILRQKRAIESSAGYPITGFINNSHLLKETTLDDIVHSNQLIKQLEEKTHLPVCYTAIKKELIPPNPDFLGTVIPLTLYLRNTWL